MWKHLNNVQAEQKLSNLELNNYNFNGNLLSQSYMEIRNRINEKFRELDFEKETYKSDLDLALYIYNYFTNEEQVPIREMENNEFWIYLSIEVFPDLVHQRFPNNFKDHAYNKPERIWLKSLWWFIYFSWQGDIESTRRVLENKRFTTDSILNLVERTGNNGVYVDVYRFIMKYYANCPDEKYEKLNNSIQDNATVFRLIMKLHTARMLLIQPSLYEGGEEGYVKSIFSDLNLI